VAEAGAGRRGAGPDSQATPQTGRDTPSGGADRSNQPERHSRVNVGNWERATSVAAGSILALSGLNRRSIPGLVIGAVGGAMIYRGVTGHCHAYQALDIDTANEDGRDAAQHAFERGIAIETAMLIGRPAEQLYAFWRDFANLPKILGHIESVTVEDGGKRSHWVAKAPLVAGGRVEWDAEVTADEPNQRIAWQSVGGNTVDTAGEIRFEKAPGDRGTEV